jgi:polyhydroxybutyrate depolymerase
MLFASLGFALCTSAAVPAAAQPASTDASSQARSAARGTRAELSLERPEGTRSYVAIVPQAAPDAQAALVIALHGFGGSGANIIEQGGWDEAAKRHGFIVLGPDGSVEHANRRASFVGNPRSWNAGPEAGTPAAARGVDDVGFLRALIRAWVDAGRVDARRVYITGFSNGAGMTFRAGIELADQVAAIAPLANSPVMAVNKLTYPVSLIMLWGDADPLNPYQGGVVKRKVGNMQRIGAMAALEQWRTLLGCAADAQTRQLKADLSVKTHAGCAGGSEAQLYTIAGMGHQWPGGRDSLTRISGPGSNTIDATETVWEFFKRHPRRR